jgi:hypothetical protein
MVGMAAAAVALVLSSQLLMVDYMHLHLVAMVERVEQMVVAVQVVQEVAVLSGHVAAAVAAVAAVVMVRRQGMAEQEPKVGPELY